MRPTVTYIRISRIKPAASELAVRQQRVNLDRYLNDTVAYVVEEFIKEAFGNTGEVFIAACHAAVRHNATLVIGSLQPIGSDKALTTPHIPLLREGFSIATGGPWMPISNQSSWESP